MLLTSIFLLLLSNSLSLRRDISIYYSRIGIIIQLYCILFCYNNLFISYLNSGVGLFGGLFSITSLDLIFDMLIFMLTMFILNLTGFYPRKYWTNKYLSINMLLFNKLKLFVSNIFNKKGEQYTIIEYTLILLFIVMGSLLLISSSDLISVYLSIELQSYGLYILCTLYRNSESSTSSGLTYFLLGGLSSCFILLGIGLIYANSGTTYLDSFYIITNLSNLINDNNLNYIMYNDISTYISYYLLLITVGFLFKISAAPFHFWSPDVYDGIPTIVTTFVAIMPKISILIILLHLVHFSNNISIEYSWTSSLLISSILSLIIGTVLGLTQFRIKRLFAYSTISHVGFLLLALSINSVESIQSFIFYLIQYSISNLNVFFILIGIGYTLYFYINKNIDYNNLLDKNNSPIQLINQLKGYFYINPILSISLAITLLSFAGIPPLVGFFAKLMVLSSALQNGFIFLALIGILTSVVSAVYYLNVIKIMFFNNHSYIFSNKLFNFQIPAEIINKNNIESFNLKSNISLSNSLSVPISILTMFILLFMFMPDQWLDISNILSFILFTPYNII
uniref:NADH-ubiquinone oxidoreductase chain 2 n=1 Tax=Trichophyton rubrum TaxID=5551 RepID=C5HA22_TRIRU|nr:NADH dehydrogenase subunit 2 [Trichophyton rubrum]YP_010951128.1 NADH dehydrogenase subunit 2 [Trichophyton soudanense]ACR19571.1 NADH dehydrogenase subunit 2 [Trichophyton rubrum]QUL58744.1 NADH dehydrogenase subunit 2 [Trichophyton kuryangei]WML69525.1 NADH dehydrogenase subunit 2 [Trichophyton soudanense]